MKRHPSPRCSRTKRKPRLSFRFDGSFALRFAARQFRALLVPRATADHPLVAHSALTRNHAYASTGGRAARSRRRKLKLWLGFKMASADA